MSGKSKMAAALTGGLTGAGAGSAFGPLGSAAGGALGAIGGLFADAADDEAMRDDPEYQAAKRRERSMKMMSERLGRAFGAIKPTTTQASMAVSRGV